MKKTYCIIILVVVLSLMAACTSAQKRTKYPQSSSASEGISSSVEESSINSTPTPIPTTTPEPTPSPTPGCGDIYLKLQDAELQYPAQNDLWKYNVYDNHIEISEYVGVNETEIAVPDVIDNLPVRVIGQGAFAKADIQSIVLPNSVVWIKNKAFARNSQITNVTLGDNIAVIGAEAFSECTGITSISIPNVIYIGEKAFMEMESLASVEFGGDFSIGTISSNAFQGCSSLSHVELPYGVAEIGEGVFRDCYNMEIAVLPASLEELPDFTFYGCHSLSSVQIDDGIERIGSHCFYECSNLHKVVLPHSVVFIGPSSFEGCTGSSSSKHEFDLKVLNAEAEFGYSPFTDCIVFGDPRFAFNVDDWKENITIHAAPASTAAQFCADYGIPFQVLSDS